MSHTNDSLKSFAQNTAVGEVRNDAAYVNSESCYGKIGAGMSCLSKMVILESVSSDNVIDPENEYRK